MKHCTRGQPNQTRPWWQIQDGYDCGSKAGEYQIFWFYSSRKIQPQSGTIWRQHRLNVKSPFVASGVTRSVHPNPHGIETMALEDEFIHVPIRNWPLENKHPWPLGILTFSAHWFYFWHHNPLYSLHQAFMTNTIYLFVYLWSDSPWCSSSHRGPGTKWWANLGSRVAFTVPCWRNRWLLGMDLNGHMSPWVFTCLAALDDSLG